MNSSHDDRPLRRPGCPIRRSPDQSLLSGYPKLIAACHVLLRLLAPRHPPCALSSLTTIERATTLEHSSSAKHCPIFSCQRSAGDRRDLTHGTSRLPLVPARKRLERASPEPPRSGGGSGDRARACISRFGFGRLPCQDGAEGGRTLDLRLAKPALSQLSYSPARPVVMLFPEIPFRGPSDDGGPR